jgi:hypothetical protein
MRILKESGSKKSAFPLNGCWKSFKCIGKLWVVAYMVEENQQEVPCVTGSLDFCKKIVLQKF